MLAGRSGYGRHRSLPLSCRYRKIGDRTKSITRRSPVMISAFTAMPGAIATRKRLRSAVFHPGEIWCFNNYPVHEAFIPMTGAFT
jgi:hypothetical protein